MTVPEHSLNGLIRYRDDGVPTGGFLNAVLEGDFKQAELRADLLNREHLRCIFDWVRDNIDPGIHGSRDAIGKHIAMKFKERHGDS